MYEADQGTVTSALKSSSTAVFTDDTISKILSLTTHDNTTVRFDTVAPDANGNVTVTSGAEVVLLDTSDTAHAVVNAPSSAPVVIFQGLGGVTATLNDGRVAHQPTDGVTERVVVTGAGADKVIVADHTNTLITAGDHDTVIAGGGYDTVVAGMGNSTIIGGTGHAIVEMQGDAAAYTVTVDNGHAIVAHEGSTTDISKIQFVQLDGGKALIFANDTQQAAVTTIYETTFGRTADAGGLQYWFDKAAAGVSLDEIANAFLTSNEYVDSGRDGLTDAEFVQHLYLDTFGRAAEDDGLAYWVNALEHGGATRAQLINSFVNIAANTIDGTLHTEATIVGSVTIVHNIV